ncbi:hypothetical protein EAL2_c21520 [Peptoclostridium acidaminophilum DSM 3953]|uniref:Lipoprotein n=2 Tax=Peptoclostridium acidaminophilum TaxID=1731 RepID=W8THW3_PEPAC|nr:hypothetical protein EAL2_c21520 [Peptoclostridium acidaminophilum DSM 3953]
MDMKRLIVAVIAVISIAIGTMGCAMKPAGESEKTVMESFEKLAAAEHDEKAVLDFAKENISSLSPENASKVIAELEKTQKGLVEQRIDEAFEGSLQERLIEQSGMAAKIDSPGQVQDQDLKEFVEMTRQRGYTLISLEGNFYPYIDYSMYKEYSKYVTGDWKSYIEIMNAEYMEFAMRDGALAISMEEFLGRILTAEKFMREFPESPKVPDIKKLYMFYIAAYLNWAVFEPPGNTLSQEASEGYKKAIAIEDESRFLELFKQYYTVLESEGFKLTPNVQNEINKLTQTLESEGPAGN